MQKHCDLAVLLICSIVSKFREFCVLSGGGQMPFCLCNDRHILFFIYMMPVMETALLRVESDN